MRAFGTLESVEPGVTVACHFAHAHSSQCCVWVWCSPPTPQAAAEDPTCPVFAYLCLSSPSVSQSRISHGSSLFQPCPPHLSHCIILSLPLPSPPCRNLACSQPSILTRHLKYAILFRIIYLAISTEVLLCSDPDTGGSLGAASEFEGRSAKPGMILHTRAVSWSAAESVASEHEQILSAGIQCVVLSSPSTAQPWLFFLWQRPGTHCVPAYLHVWES